MMGFPATTGESEQAPEVTYPPDLTELKEDRLSYKDEAAAQMFNSAGGRRLQASSTMMAVALERQAEKLQQFYSTPFTEQNIQTIKTTLEGLERVQAALQEWHWMIYPNQRPKADHDQT